MKRRKVSSESVVSVRRRGALYPRVAWTSLLAVLLTLGCGGAGAAGDAAAPDGESPKAGARGSQHPLLGAPAPDFKLPAQGGSGAVSPAAFAGKVVIVDFWATWCAPCRESFPYYQSLTKRHGADVVVLAVSVDDEADGIPAFVADTGVTFLIGWDQEKSVAGRYEPKSMPSSFIIDRNGVIRHVHEGFREGDAARIDAMVDELLR